MTGGIALTRAVSPAVARCELTHIEREPIDLDRARIEHAALEDALRQAGWTVRCLPAEPDLPDSVFVEDTALVLPEVAVITRPGADSRRGELATIAAALEPYREIVHVEAPATLDGGDVIIVDHEVFVGLSTRTSNEGVDQLTRLLAPYGYRVSGVPVHGFLHLKSGACRVADRTLLIHPRWIAPAAFGRLECLFVDESEPFAANALWLGDRVIHPAGFPRTRHTLEQRGLTVVPVEAGELAKAEGGVTCCTLLVEAG